MSGEDLRTRLEDVHAELQALEDDLPEPLTLTPALRCVEATRGACSRLGHGNLP